MPPVRYPAGAWVQVASVSPFILTFWILVWAARSAPTYGQNSFLSLGPLFGLLFLSYFNAKSQTAASSEARDGNLLGWRSHLRGNFLLTDCCRLDHLITCPVSKKSKKRKEKKREKPLATEGDQLNAPMKHVDIILYLLSFCIVILV